MNEHRHQFRSTLVWGKWGPTYRDLCECGANINDKPWPCATDGKIEDKEARL